MHELRGLRPNGGPRGNGARSGKWRPIGGMLGSISRRGGPDRHARFIHADRLWRGGWEGRDRLRRFAASRRCMTGAHTRTHAAGR